MCNALSIPFLISSILASTAFAQADSEGCLNRDELVETLEKKYDELKVAQGLMGDGRVLEIFSSRETGSWTAAISDANGQTCVLMSGGYWLYVPKEEPSF